MIGIEEAFVGLKNLIALISQLGHSLLELLNQLHLFWYACQLSTSEPCLHLLPCNLGAAVETFEVLY